MQISVDPHTPLTMSVPAPTVLYGTTVPNMRMSAASPRLRPLRSQIISSPRISIPKAILRVEAGCQPGKHGYNAPGRMALSMRRGRELQAAVKGEFTLDHSQLGESGFAAAQV